MLVLNKTQINRLESAQTAHFADELFDHARRYAPAACASMGPAALRATVALGIGNARRHGFTLQGSIRFHVEAMLLLGSHFDSDPQYRRVTAPLFGPRGRDELDVADALYDAVGAYVAETSGSDHRHEIGALDRATQAAFGHVASFAARPAADAVDLLRRLHPEKFAAIGEDAVTALVTEARASALRRDPAQHFAWPLFAGLMYTFGHRCLDDPQFPWIAATLDVPDADDSAHAIERLFDACMAYLRQARARLGAP